jgi:hypothetical protein
MHTTRSRSYHVGIGCSSVENGNVRGILVDNRPDGVTEFFSNQPSMIRSKRRNVRSISVGQVLKVKLLLKVRCSL